MRTLMCNLFWCERTCDKRNEVHNNHGSRVEDSTSGSKVSSICKPTVRYLYKIIANTILANMRAKVAPI